METTNSYNRIKDFIFTNLKKKTELMDEEHIKEEINTAQNLIETVGLDKFVLFLPDKTDLEPLSEADWKRMENELERHFNVKMKVGIVIQGEEQQRRDNTWWTSKEKIRGKNYYSNRYIGHIKDFLPDEVVAAIDSDTDVVMNNIGNPNLEIFDRRGMVVGHVQSGKTGNYAALVCKAADAGYKFIVVIAGGTNNLRNQTQKRLNESFVGRDQGIQVGAGVGNSPQELLPICLTTADRDFNKRDADKNSQGLNFDNSKTPILAVIKKEPKALKNVIDWLQKQYPNKITNHAMLVIDDESDYASINTKELTDPTVINKNIRQLMTLFSKASYVAYTATPYANIFIDHEAVFGDYGDDLFPKDFIYALDAPDNYFGARRIFLDTREKHLIRIKDADLSVIPLNHKIDFIPPFLPKALREAIRLFIINVSIRRIRGQESKHNSMLVHVSRFTALHQKIASYIENYLSEIKKDIDVYGRLIDAADHSSNIKELQETLESVLSERPAEETWEAVLDSICDSINSIIVREVHLKSKIPLEYRDDIATNAIVVGGVSLARGFTLEGLSVSYFTRSTIFYDTLMQMGRWFGYRPGYEDLCRIYSSNQIITHFRDIIEATEELFEMFQIMAENNRTPAEFGLYVQQHPDSALQVTARNKQKNVHDFYLDMNLDGHLKETAYLSPNEDDKNKNLEAIENIIDTLSSKTNEKVGNSYLWRDVDKSIVQNFLEKFKVYSIDPLGITTRMPIGFIKEYVNDRDTLWDVALYSGDGSEKRFEKANVVIKKEERQLDPKEPGYFEVRNRQVSSGKAEEISLNETQKAEAGGKRNAIRAKLEKPLLMLHILEVQNQGDFAAFGISFPGDGIRKNKTVRIRINSVYYKDLLKQLEDETNDEQ